MRIRPDKFLFLCSLLSLSFAYGYISHSQQIFPHELLREAKIAYQSIVELRQDETIPGVDFWDDSGLTKPKAIPLAQKRGKENIFFLGDEHAHRDLCPETGCLAWITDRRGNIIHAWKNFPDLWEPLEGREAIGDTWSAYPVGAYLYPNGDILVSFHGMNVFPIAMGLAKFDKDSNLLWKRSGYYHHWFTVDEEGRIYIPSMRVVDSPLEMDDLQKYFVCKKELFQVESVEILDLNGNLIKNIDIYDALIDSELAGVFNNNGKIQDKIETCDPMHLNYVGVLTPSMAAEFPDFEPGDLLLSFRSMNALAVLSPETKLFKWFYVGAVQNQHSPKFLGGNRILIFDNLGGDKSRGTSRIVALDVSSENSTDVFPSPAMKIPSRPIYSETAGYIDVHPDRRRVLVSWTHQGLVWEIDMESGEVLWEYVNTHPVEDRYGRISVYTATYADKTDFPFNGGKVP